MTRGSVLSLLEEWFPAIADAPDADCWVAREFRERFDRSEDWLDMVVDVVSANGGRAAFGERLLTAHPSGVHKPSHDNGLLDVFTEAEAFAWAVQVRHFTGVQFSPSPAAPGPDVRAPHQAWIEAKTIRYSDGEREARAAMYENAKRGLPAFRVGFRSSPLPALSNKFSEKLDIALRQFRLVESEPLSIVYFRLFVDFRTAPNLAAEALLGVLETRALPSNVEVAVYRGDPWERVVVDWPRGLPRPESARPTGGASFEWPTEERR